jgi:hypothetical protein
MPLSPLPSTATTVNDATIGTVGSILPPPPSTTTAIAAIDDPHRHCHTVDNDNRQKPEVVDRHQWRQWRSLLMEAAVNGSHGNGVHCSWRSLSTEAAVGWRDNDAMALAIMASLTDGGSGDGGCHSELCSGG